MDTLTANERSQLMAKIRSKNSMPEMLVRRLVHSLGYRYRLHCTDLPGTPDIVFRGLRKIILMHGCFWHGHPRCPNNRMPKSRLDFWVPKITGNRKRDLKNARELRKQGWSILVIWECQTKNAKKLLDRVSSFLSS
jgi:DNA mismatch endonuclease, patch repair protein